MNADSIVAEIHRIFGTLTKGKPKVKSNGRAEFTVVSAIVAAFPDGQFQLVSLASGVKVLPNAKLVANESKGYLVHDSHAEVLAMRLFNLYLLSEVQTMQQHGRASDRLDIIRQCESGSGFQYTLRSDVKLVLYISELPCGDASLLGGASQSSELEAWQQPAETVGDTCTGTAADSVVRGKSGFFQLGCVRTKPGRKDSLPTMSKSCSDKLTLKQGLGLLNCLTAKLIDPQNSYLSAIIVPQKKYTDNIENIKRCFDTRFAPQFESRYYKLQKFEFVTTSLLFAFDKLAFKDADACMDSILYIPDSVYEVVNNGVKLGCNSKGRTVKPSSSSVVCRKKMVQKAAQLCKLNEESYEAVKQSSTERQRVKQKCRSCLGVWPRTGDDDFVLRD